MAKINAYLPDELEEQARSAGLSWSPLLQKAVRQALGQIPVPPDEIESLRHIKLIPLCGRLVVFRLKSGSHSVAFLTSVEPRQPGLDPTLTFIFPSGAESKIKTADVEVAVVGEWV